ncbi:SGNH/GDSL hydrolase family protein [Rhizobium leguminosarum]
MTGDTYFPNGPPVALAGSNTNGQGRNGHVVGPSKVKNIVIVDAHAYVAPGSGQEFNSPANTMTWQRAYEKLTGINTPVRALYDGGSTTHVSNPGELIFSDAHATMEWDADTTNYTGFYRTVPLVTDTMSAVTNNGVGSAGFRTTGGSQLLRAGGGVLNNSGTTSGPACPPAMVLGIPYVPMACVIGVVDSIGYFKDDTNTSSTQGFFSRAMRNVNGHCFPWHKQGIDANKIQNQMVAVAPVQKLLWPYVTDIFIQLGTNDIAASADLATMKARFSDLATYARNIVGPYGRYLRVHASSIIPRGTFTGAMNTVRSDYNAWLAAGADGLVDKYHDINAAAGDYTTYPNDQIHPGPTQHAAMAAVVSANMVPYADPYFQARLAA